MSRSTQRKDIPIHKRYSITVDEAVAYFTIGENRMRELVKSGKYADYISWMVQPSESKESTF